MERLKTIKNNLISCVEGQMANLQTVDTKELGEAVDMIKDIEEAIYYCTITKAMNEQEKEKERYYTEKMYPDYYRDMDNPYEKRYYAGGGSMRGNSGSYNGNTGSRAYIESYPMMRDYREGKSPISRKTYMETKETHQGHEVQMKELNKYMKELSEDITEMISDATPEQKTVLKQKLIALSDKIGV